ncbi:MAG TPA: protein kinase [Thermoanaerobaculia bacterium]|nr:protein kinase [Thermoanaerobaculia bacterium]
MSLPAGTRLGPYEILAPLGAGGMGEVYKARDTRLGRDVAVKVLPSHLSDGPDLKVRFEREARAIAALSHPHICALYDVGSHDGMEYLVMELIEGQVLSGRLEKGALPTEQVLRFGVQIADALDRAHRAEIIHRDLKPGNVMLTKSGVKLLDFGLAKMAATEKPSSDLSSLPTQAEASRPLTEKGTIMGTFQYMAPEQVEGKDADARTDIFALGCLLYEMTTGRKAFSGTSRASLIGAIMNSEPPSISSIQPMTPPALDHVVRRCLAKEPDDRWQSAADVASELRWVAEAGSQAGAPATVVSRRKTREKLAWTAVAVAAAALAIVLVRRPPSETFRTRSFLLPPEKVEFDTSGNNCASLTISPDGRNVTFAARGADGKVMLWLRSLDELTARPIPGTEGASFPFWSPDSRSLAFFADGKLLRVDLAGSPPLAICDAPNGRSGSWSRAGIILFSPDTNTEIFQVPAAGGPATPVTKLDITGGETTHRWAAFLPDGKRFLYTAGSHSAGARSESNAIYLAALGSQGRTRLLQARSNVAYASGFLFSMREHVLLAQRFDADSGRLKGDPVPLAYGVQYEPSFFRGDFSTSDNGLLVYATGAADAGARLRWFDTSGKPLGEPFGEAAEYRQIAVSPDGSRIAATIADPVKGLPEIWLIDSRGVRTRFTFGAPAFSPVYSSDGTRIAYAKGSGIYVRPANGGGQEDWVYHSDAQTGPSDWSRDGRFIAFDYVKPGSKTKQDIWILPLFGDRKPYPFLATEFLEQGASFSPNGRWISYLSDESGRPELYVAAFPGPGGKWQVSTEGSAGGSWLSAGKIAFGSLDGRALVVDVEESAGGLEVGAPRVVFKVPPTDSAPAVPLDGQRLLLAVHSETTETPRVVLLTNWMAGLKQR